MELEINIIGHILSFKYWNYSGQFCTELKPEAGSRLSVWRADDFCRRWLSGRVNNSAFTCWSVSEQWCNHFALQWQFTSAKWLVLFTSNINPLLESPWQTYNALTLCLWAVHAAENNTHSLFFSLTLAPFLSSSSVTCFLLGWGDATAQC